MSPSLLQLRRITSSGRFVPEIDGLRFVAIASVVVTHLYAFVLINRVVPDTHDALRTLVEHGYRGVNLFYVISGFILGLPFAAHYLKGKRAVPLRPYFLRRLTRLEPPYIINLSICSTLLILVDGVRVRSLLPHFGASLVYLHSLWFGQQSMINPVAWTLEVEVQFYCLLPVLAVIFRVRSRLARRMALVGIILLVGIVQMLYWDGSARAKLTFLYGIQFFLTGLLLADLYVVDWNENPAANWRWDLVSVVCWPLIFAPRDLNVWVYLPFLMLATYVGAFKGIVFKRIFRNHIVATIGGMCYTIYLFHYQLITAVLRFSKPVHLGKGFDTYFALQFLIYAPILLLVSCSYFALVERPCMARDWPQRAFHRIIRLAKVKPRERQVAPS